MTAPRKPSKRLLLTESVASDAPPPDLTPAEQSLLRSFRAMDDRSQAFIGRAAVGCPRRVRLHRCDW
jgi:hypothetical protein